jgi:hypothetical protein
MNGRRSAAWTPLESFLVTRLGIVFISLVVGLAALSCQNPATGGGESSGGGSSTGGTGTISGKITIASYPVQGATVTTGSATGTTDFNGNYTITGLANGSYTVTPGKTGWSFSPPSASVTLSGSSGATSIDFDSGPALPVPASYTQNLPNQSMPVLIKEVPLTVSFSPTLYGGYISSNTVIYHGASVPVDWFTPPQWIGSYSGLPGLPGCSCQIDVQRATLVDSSGSIVQNPQANFKVFEPAPGGAYNTYEFTGTFAGLTQKPVLELTACWQLLSVNRYAANTSTTYSQTITYGITNTSTNAFTNTFNASAGLDIKAFKATLSYTFSNEVTNSMSITQTTSTTSSYTVSLGDKQGVLAVWQLVYQIAAVRKATASEIVAGHDQFGNPIDSNGYVPFSDPNFVNGTTNGLNPNDVAPVSIQQQNDVVPQMTLF